MGYVEKCFLKHAFYRQTLRFLKSLKILKWKFLLQMVMSLVITIIVVFQNMKTTRLTLFISRSLSIFLCTEMALPLS